MALTKLPTISAVVVSLPPKQIAAVSSTSGQVMYTVPTGRKFIGCVSANSGNTWVGINGVQLSLCSSNGSTNQFFNHEATRTFVAGTVVACGSGQVTLLGVEYDA